MVKKFLNYYTNILFILFLILIIAFNKKEKLILDYLIVSLISLEIIFLILFFVVKKQFYKMNKIAGKKDLFVQPHPYLPFETKPNFTIKNDVEAQVKNDKKYFTPEYLKTNSLGFCNGPRGNREVSKKKKIKICCLGASTTGNYFYHENKNISYPILLENILKQKYKNKIEVNNFGQGGYNSQELIIVFLTKILFTKPDIVIFYHGYNDLRSYFSNNFKFDYSHSRVSLYKNIWKLKTSHFLSLIPLGFINKIANKYSLQNSLLEFIGKNQVNFKNSPDKGLEVYKKNIECLVDICKERKIEIILSTYCYKKDHKAYSAKFAKIISKENSIVKKIAKQKKVLLVDNFKLIKKNDHNFLDSIHFTPYGMKKLAKNFEISVTKCLKKKKLKKS